MVQTYFPTINDHQPGADGPARFEPVEFWMPWPWLEVEPEWVEIAGTGLQWMYGHADRQWNEDDTKRLIIHPVMTQLLGFPVRELTATPHPVARYDGAALLPDYYLPQACVIEAKKIGVSLLRYYGESSNFRNALDQGLSYLDAYPAVSCIVTNGWDWYAFWRAFDRHVGAAGTERYFGARFRLDEVIEAGDRTRLGQFLAMFNAISLSGRANRTEAITGFTSYPIQRGLYRSSSRLYFADGSTRPLKGRGSGFRAPPDARWPMRA